MEVHISIKLLLLLLDTNTFTKWLGLMSRNTKQRKKRVRRQSDDTADLVALKKWRSSWIKIKPQKCFVTDGATWIIKTLDYKGVALWNIYSGHTDLLTLREWLPLEIDCTEVTPNMCNLPRGRWVALLSFGIIFVYRTATLNPPFIRNPQPWVWHIYL